MRAVFRLCAASVNAPGVPAGPVIAASVTVTVTVLGAPTGTLFGATLTAVMVLRGFTACETGEEDVLALKFALPLNAAVMECGLAEDDSSAVVKVALPVPLSAALPISITPS